MDKEIENFLKKNACNSFKQTIEKFKKIGYTLKESSLIELEDEKFSIYITFDGNVVKTPKMPNTIVTLSRQEITLLDDLINIPYLELGFKYYASQKIAK